MCRLELKGNRVWASGTLQPGGGGSGWKITGEETSGGRGTSLTWTKRLLAEGDGTSVAGERGPGTCLGTESDRKRKGAF